MKQETKGAVTLAKYWLQKGPSSIVKGVKIKAQLTQVTFKTKTFLVVNAVNPCKQLEPVAKYAWGKYFALKWNFWILHAKMWWTSLNVITPGPKYVIGLGLYNNEKRKIRYNYQLKLYLKLKIT